MTKPPAYYELTTDQQVLVDKLWETGRDELERKAMLKILLEPGYEESFIVRYFGHRIDAKLEDFHMRLIDTALNAPRGLVLFPAGHGKTTLISTILPILEMIREPDMRISLIGKNDDEAAAIMSSVQSELEQNDLLVQDYGPFRPDAGDPMRKWSTSYLSIRGRKRIGKEHTFTVFGAGSRQILGWRSDWVICDDVVTEKNSATPDQRSKHVTWFNDCVSTSPDKAKARAGKIAGRITVVGTMFHPHDLYATITGKTKVGGKAMYATHREDAIRNEMRNLPLWPAVWSWEDLMDVKASEGTLSFNKRYRNKPVDESMQPFREEYIKGDPEHKGCFHRELVLGDCEPDWRVFQSLDPAVGKTKSAKFCGHIVFAIPPEMPRVRVLLEINREQWTIIQQADKIIETHLHWEQRANMVLSVTELNAYQAGLNQVIEERCERMGITIRLEGHTTGRNKQDPEIGIPSLGPVVENGDLWIPYGNAESIRKGDMLAEELIEYPFFKYSDLLMALWFGHLKSQAAIAPYKSLNRLKPQSRYRNKTGKKMLRNPYFHNRGLPTPSEQVPELLDVAVAKAAGKHSHLVRLDQDETNQG